jgi:GDPmannose 4,6-dehydratase
MAYALLRPLLFACDAESDKPDTFVLATNQTQTVRQFVEMAFKTIGISLEWKGKQENEVGLDKNTGKSIVRINPRYYRPCEVELLIGNPQKAKEKLGWEPKITLEDMCKMMVDADIRRNRSGFSF